MALYIAVENTDDEIERLKKSTYFHCQHCGINVYTTVARIEAHEESCKRKKR